jgi:hypothetical protein
MALSSMQMTLWQTIASMANFCFVHTFCTLIFQDIQSQEKQGEQVDNLGSGMEMT